MSKMSELHRRLHEINLMVIDGELDFDDAVGMIRTDYPVFDYEYVVGLLLDVSEEEEYV
jgi:hypothetical protein